MDTRSDKSFLKSRNDKWAANTVLYPLPPWPREGCVEPYGHGAERQPKTLILSADPEILFLLQR